MRKILNIVLGDMSTGELGIALSFVKGQSPNKYKYSFLIPKDKVGIIDNPNITIYSISKDKEPIQNQRIIDEIIDSVSPDIIILFDAFTFEYSQSWTGYNMRILKEKGIPIASIDEYEYTRTDYKLDYYGIFVKKLPDLLSQCDFVLKNCPLNMPKAASDSNVYYYRAISDLPLMSDAQKKEYRNKIIGSDDNDSKIVFFTTSAWEVEGAYSFACQNELAKWLGPILFNYLCELDTKITLLHIGKEKWTLESNSQVKYVHIDSLPTEDFEQYIQVSDLFITYNIVSISLSKAIMFNIPSIVLNNRKIIEFNKLTAKLAERPMWYQNMAHAVKKVYPISASLFGWFSFLRKVLEDNPYVDTFDVAQVFNYGSTLKLIDKALNDRVYQNNILDRQTSFIEKYNDIPDAQQIMDRIFTII